MVCWSENVDWRRILGKLRVPVSEEDKSKAIWDLEDEMGHDYLKSLPEEEVERLLLEKLAEMKGLVEPRRKKRKKGKKHEEIEEEEEPAQSFYM
ncbi:MAG: hypothetical protein JW839_18900 [Candidatus Lokiarchaeota archaeon]|nr:hypothetical protein [Candidatus Lokiarchaeota archaeon]